jgi:hypothetical protein
VTALNEQWQAARRLRQQEVVERRNQVLMDLERCQAHRLAHTLQLRQHLSQAMADLQGKTQQWLIETAQQRQATVPALRQSLQTYTHRLRIDTDVLLDAFQTEREAEALAIRQTLEQDRQALQIVVSELRLEIAGEIQQIQRQVEAIQRQAAVDLAGYRQQQAMVRAELLPQLTAYVEALQAEVQGALANMGTVRQQAATHHRIHRQGDRQALTALVNDMFDQLATFRQELKTYRATLSTLVWGNESASAVIPPPQAQPVSPPTPQPTRRPQPRPSVATSPVPRSKAVIVPPAVIPVAVPKSVVSEPVVSQPVRPEPTAPDPIAPPASAPTPGAIPSLEEVIYNYLHLAQGARIADLESELGINRFQAVDALRSLIQKDLVVKQDRTYRVQEEAVL